MVILEDLIRKTMGCRYNEVFTLKILLSSALFKNNIKMKTVSVSCVYLSLAVGTKLHEFRSIMSKIEGTHITQGCTLHNHRRD
jgi:hypothetical protein